MRETKPHGATVPVTLANRAEYVQAYAHQLLVGQVETPLLAFKAAFASVCAGPALALFSPADLELLLCGSAEYNLGAAAIIWRPLGDLMALLLHSRPRGAGAVRGLRPRRGAGAVVLAGCPHL